VSTETKIEWTDLLCIREFSGHGAGEPVSRPTRVCLSAPTGARDRSPARSGSCLLCIYPLATPPFARSRNCSPWGSTISAPRRLPRRSCLTAEPCAVKREVVLICVGLALDVGLTAQVLRADYVVKRGLKLIGEPQNGKRLHGEPLRSIERQDLNRDVWQFGYIHEPPELCMHKGSVPDCPVQDGFIEHPRQFQRLVFRQQFLPDQPCLHSPLCAIPPRGSGPGGGGTSAEFFDNVELALIGAWEEGGPFLWCVTEDRLLSLLAVADTNLASRLGSYLDAVAISDTARTFDPLGQRTIPRIHRISATAAAAVISNMQKRAVCPPLDMASRSRRAISTTARSFHCIGTPSRCAQRPLDSSCSRSGSSWKPAIPA